MPRNYWLNSRRRTRSTSSAEDAVNNVKEHWAKVGVNVDLFRLNGKFCDVEVHVGSEQFKAHKIVLASCSPYFDALFSSGLYDKEHEVIELKEVNPEVFKMLFNYMYKGDIEIKEDNVEQLLAGANFLTMQDVVTNCCSFLRKKLAPSNAVGVFRFAELYNCTALKLDVKRFIERHFAEVSSEEEFYDLTKVPLKAFLRSEGLSIYNEFQVFEAVMKWLLKNPDERRDHIFELMDCVRLPLVSTKQIECCISDCPDAQLKGALENLMEDFNRNLEKIQVERKSLLSEASASGMSDFTNSYHDLRFQPRMCCRKSVYIIGGNHQSGHSYNDCRTLFKVEKLDTFKNHWKTMPAMTYPRSSLGVAALNSVIYAVGGENDSMILDACEAFDPLDNEWYPVCSLRYPRSCLGLCAQDGHLFAIGGCIGLEVDNGIERYDPVKNKWEMFDRLPQKMFSMGVIAYEGLIYIIGGFDENSGALNTAYSYNPVTKQFCTLPSMCQHRGHFGIVVLHNFIYAIGGTSGHDCSLVHGVERFSVFDNSWTSIAPMSVARVAPCVAAVNDTIMVIGGKVAFGANVGMPHTLNTVEIYEPEQNKWHDGIPMQTSRCEAASVTM